MILYHFTDFEQFGINEPGEYRWTADLLPFGEGYNGPRRSWADWS